MTTPAWHGERPAFTPAHYRSLQSLLRGMAVQLCDAQTALEEGSLNARCGPRLTSALDAAESEQFSLFGELSDALRRLQSLLAAYQGAAMSDRAADAARRSEAREQDTETAITAYWNFAARRRRRLSARRLLQLRASELPRIVTTESFETPTEERS